LTLKVHPTSKSPSVTLYQGEVIKAVVAKAAEGGLRIDSRYLYDNHYLDFEAAFKANGWHVEYDSPGYCEDYEAHWKFSS
jgi:hypothetical protein